MTRLWSTWLPDLLPQLPSCPVPLVEHELRRAAQEFFGRTRAWLVTLPPVPVQASAAEVAVTPPDATIEIVRINQAWYDNSLLSPATGDALADEFGSGWQARTGTPIRYVQETPGVLRLFPIPDVATAVGLVVRAAVRPSDSSPGIADDLAATYKSPLTSGAKARLMMYADKPWSAPDHGIKHDADFQKAIDEANIAAATSGGRSRIASRVRWF